MKKIIAISASNSPASINHELLRAAAFHLEESEVDFISFTDVSLPVYNESVEEQEGIPLFIQELHRQLLRADGFIISVPEHNGLPPACFKNILDWLSRIGQGIFNDKPVLLLSTSPGANGGNSGLRILSALMPRWGGRVTGIFSLGNFYQHFDREALVILNEAEARRLYVAVNEFKRAVTGVGEMQWQH